MGKAFRDGDEHCPACKGRGEIYKLEDRALVIRACGRCMGHVTAPHPSTVAVQAGGALENPPEPASPLLALLRDAGVTTVADMQAWFAWLAEVERELEDHRRKLREAEARIDWLAKIGGES